MREAHVDNDACDDSGDDDDAGDKRNDNADWLSMVNIAMVCHRGDHHDYGHLPC